MKAKGALISVVVIIVIFSGFIALNMPRSEYRPKKTAEPTNESQSINTNLEGTNAYYLWLSSYTSGEGSLEADFNNDGVVDGKDYVIWLNTNVG